MTQMEMEDLLAELSAHELVIMHDLAASIAQHRYGHRHGEEGGHICAEADQAIEDMMRDVRALRDDLKAAEERIDDLLLEAAGGA